MRRHLPSSSSFGIDLKSLSIEVSHGIRITEKSSLSHSLLRKNPFLGYTQFFSSLIEAPLNQKFNKSCLDEYDLWVEKVSN